MLIFQWRGYDFFRNEFYFLYFISTHFRISNTDNVLHTSFTLFYSEGVNSLNPSPIVSMPLAFTNNNGHDSVFVYLRFDFPPQDYELNELRKTVEMLRKQNADSGSHANGNHQRRHTINSVADSSTGKYHLFVFIFFYSSVTPDIRRFPKHVFHCRINLFL